MLDKIIFFAFAFLFFLVPLIFTPFNFELFEFNKMLLTYFLVVTITGCWILKMVQQKKLIFNRTPLDIPLLLFLISQILSTIFSIDSHTSIFGYYSRLNGGLLSLISYLLLYFSFVSNIPKEKISSLLKVALVSGAIVALWGILEHFGVSPSCIILKGEFNAGCWVQDVQARVFATLGQPNWMAGYLAMLIFPALYFFLTEKKKLPYYLLLTTYYLSFTFTYSRGATLGLIGGFIIFITLSLKSQISNFKKISLIILTFLFINLFFGSALTSFKLIQKFAPPPRPSISITTPSTTQLETGGTESGQIRFIVWQGAWDIFKAYPIFGSGVETFAYSYYQFRPVAHNLTSEWDFLYNKAHNEYLNYLSTTGIVGFGTYVLVIGTFIFWCIKKIYKNNFTLYILPCTLFAAYVSYLIYISTLFSTVATAIFFYLFPAFAFVATDSTKIFNFKFSIFNFIYKRDIYTKAVKIIILLSIFYFIFSIFKLWYGDRQFALGQKYLDSGYVGQGYGFLTSSVNSNNSEPYYKSELGYAAAATSILLADQDATWSAELKQEAIYTTEKVLKENPKNVSFWRTAVRTYFEIADIQKTIETLDKTISLAPTDPKLYYNKGLILQQMDKKEGAITAFKKALELKPNYQEVINEIH